MHPSAHAHATCPACTPLPPAVALQSLQGGAPLHPTQTISASTPTSPAGRRSLTTHPPLPDPPSTPPGTSRFVHPPAGPGATSAPGALRPFTAPTQAHQHACNGHNGSGGGGPGAAAATATGAAAGAAASPAQVSVHFAGSGPRPVTAMDASQGMLLGACTHACTRSVDLHRCCARTSPARYALLAARDGVRLPTYLPVTA